MKRRRKNLEKMRKEAKENDQTFRIDGYKSMVPLLSRCDEYLVYCEARFGEGVREQFVRINVVLCGRLGKKLIMVYEGPSMDFPKHRQVPRR